MILALVAILLVADLSIWPRPLLASDLTFGNTLNLSNDPTASTAPRIAAAGSNIYAVWLNNNSLGNPEIFFRASTNNGTSFGPVIKLSNTDTGASSNPQIVAVGNNVYVVWQGFNSTNANDILFRSSSNNGASFASIRNLSNDPPDSTVPQIAATGTNVYVTWQNVVSGPSGSFDVFFSRSTDSGGTFSAKVNPSSDKASIIPQVAAAGSNVYVAWRDHSTPPDEIYVKVSTNSGLSFTAPSTGINISKSPSATSFQQKIVATGSSVYVAWTDDTATTDDVFFASSANNGSNFGNPVNLSGNAASLNPDLAAAGANVYAVWENHAVIGVSTVSLRASGNNGTSFAGTLSLSSNTGFSTNPQIAATGTNMYATWQDSTGTSDVFFVSSSDSAATFGTIVNISNNNGVSIVPVITGAGNYAYVAWQDDTPGNYDVLFKAGTPVTVSAPTANPTSINSFKNQTVPVLLSGTDPQGLPLVFSIVAMPTHGTLGPITQSAPNLAQVNYTPSLNYLGTDSFTFKVGNGSLNSSPATVTITVLQSGVSTGSRWAD